MAVVITTGSHLLKQQTGLFGVACVRINNYSSENKSLNLASLKRGTGGRSSFNGIVATVFGATGFLGRYVCNRLGKIGTQIIIPYRGDGYDVMKLKLCGDLGQIYFHQFDLRDEESIRKAVKYSNVVINLVGRDWETKNFKFKDVHVEGARRLARLSKEAGVERFIHLSALNCAENPRSVILPDGSKFLSSKWEGEQVVMQEFPDATILRPSDIYGQEDRFVRYYTHAWRRTANYLPLWDKGEKTIKQPVYSGDVAAGIIAAIKEPDSAGKIYQAVGPKRYQLSELLDYFYRVMKRDQEWGYKRYNMRWDPFFQLKISLTEKFSPNFPIGGLHWEKVEREHLTDEVKSEIPTLDDLGVNLTPVEEQMPWELKPWTYGLYHRQDADQPFQPAYPPKVAV